MSCHEFDVQEWSSAQFPKTFSVLEAGIREAVAPGFVLGLWDAQEPQKIKLQALGKRRLDPTEQAISIHTYFDLASVSKVISTASLTAVLVERGWIHWNTPIQTILPEFQWSQISIGHLLSHTSGYVAWLPFYEQLRQRAAGKPLYRIPFAKRQQWMKECVFAVRPDCAVETKTIYSDINFIILGFLLEALTQMPLARAAQKFLWSPMGISGLSYRKITTHPKDDIWNDAAATENCSWRGGVLQGQVHDDNAWAMGGVGGHAGVFGTAMDVLTFSKRLHEGFFSREILKKMWTRVSMPEGCDRTLGWDTVSQGMPSAAGRFFSKQTVGHLGFTGTSLWIDPEAGLTVTLLSNRVHPDRNINLLRDFRPRLHDAIREDLKR